MGQIKFSLLAFPTQISTANTYVRMAVVKKTYTSGFIQDYSLSNEQFQYIFYVFIAYTPTVWEYIDIKYELFINIQYIKHELFIDVESGHQLHQKNY